jgi:Tfp pilus assembly protein, ATPase PilM
VVFELTDREIRAFWFPGSSVRNKGHVSSAVRFDRIPLLPGVIEQGNVRNDEALIELLSTYALQQACKMLKVYLAIQLQQGFVRTYSLPWLAKRDRKSAISLLVAEEVPIIRSDLQYDYQVISEEKPKSIEILLCATRKSILERYVVIFKEAGFDVEGIDFAFCVLGYALGFEPKEDVLYLQAENDSIQMVLFRGSVPENVRTLLSSSFAKIDEEGAQEGIAGLENEIRRFLMYCSTQHNDLNLKRLVWSGDTIIGTLAQRILVSKYALSAEQAKIPNISEPWQKVLGENKGSGEVAVGYGLRICADHPGLNLWGQPNRERKLRRTFGRLAFLSGILLLTGIMSSIILYRNTLPLQQEVELLSHQGARVLGQAREQEELENLWEKATVHQEKVGDELLKVQAMWGPELKIDLITYKQASMSLSGKTDDSGEVQTLIHKLRTLGWQQPGLTSYKLTSPANVEFSLSAKRIRE